MGQCHLVLFLCGERVVAEMLVGSAPISGLCHLCRPVSPPPHPVPPLPGRAMAEQELAALPLPQLRDRLEQKRYRQGPGRGQRPADTGPEGATGRGDARGRGLGDE